MTRQGEGGDDVLGVPGSAGFPGEVTDAELGGLLREAADAGPLAGLTFGEELRRRVRVRLAEEETAARRAARTWLGWVGLAAAGALAVLLLVVFGASRLGSPRTPAFEVAAGQGAAPVGAQAETAAGAAAPGAQAERAAGAATSEEAQGQASAAPAVTLAAEAWREDGAVRLALHIGGVDREALARLRVAAIFPGVGERSAPVGDCAPGAEPGTWACPASGAPPRASSLIALLMREPPKGEKGGGMQAILAQARDVSIAPGPPR